MNAQEMIASFLRGEMDIITFRRLYDEQPEINDFLQGIVDDAKAQGLTKQYFFRDESDGSIITVEQFY